MILVHMRTGLHLLTSMRLFTVREFPTLKLRQELLSKKLYSTGAIQTAISPNSQEIATISYDAEVTVWSVEPLQQTNRFKVDTNGLKRIEYMTPESLVAAGDEA